jgi:hypothetical protein
VKRRVENVFGADISEALHYNGAQSAVVAPKRFAHMAHCPDIAHSA